MKQNFYPHIQGLRAVAVFLVIFYHLDKNFQLGYLGVDMFFVISGFVITKSLFNSVNHNTKNYIIDFFFKRAKRIIPPLFCVIFPFFIIYLFLGNLVNYEEVFKTLLAASIGLSNIYFYRNNENYFSETLDNPFIHTWSLGIEEQFYLFYPFLFLFFIFKKDKYFILTLSLIVLASFIYFIINDNERQLFWSPLARFWELGFGCLTFFLVQKEIKTNLILTIFSLLMSVALVLLFYQYINFNKIIIIIIAFLTSYLIHNNNLNRINILLQKKIFLYMGKISYSLYLVHFPILYFYKIYFNINFINSIIYILFTIILSGLLNRFIEEPCKKLQINYKHKLTKILVITPIFFLVTAFLLYGVTNNNLNVKLIESISISKNNLLNKKFDKYYRNSTHYKNFSYKDIKPKNCLFKKFDKNSILNNCYLKNNSKNLIMVIGDSHSAHLMPMLLHKNMNYDIIFSNIEGTAYLEEITGLQVEKNSNKHKKNLLKTLSLYEDVKKEYENTVILFANNFAGHIMNNKVIERKNISLSADQIISLIANNLKSSFSEIRKNSNIILISSLPQPNLSIYECLQDIIFKNKKKISCNYVFNEDNFSKMLNNKIIDLTRKDNLFHYFDITKKFCNTTECNFFDQNNKFNVIIRDQSHITVEFAKNNILKFNNFFDKTIKNNEN